MSLMGDEMLLRGGCEKKICGVFRVPFWWMTHPPTTFSRSVPYSKIVPFSKVWKYLSYSYELAAQVIVVLKSEIFYASKHIVLWSSKKKEKRQGFLKMNVQWNIQNSTS